MLGARRLRWADLLSGFWFRPAIIVLGFTVLALVVLAIDRRLGAGSLGIAFGGDASAARTILQTVASSLITVAGLSLTITIVTLQLVSSQFSPRAVRGLLGHNVNQIATGSFVGIFVYCLMVLRAVRDTPQDGDGGFVPGLSVTLAIGLGILGLGLLITFIHNISQSIQVANISARIAQETLRVLESLYPERFAEALADRDSEPTVRRWRRDPCTSVFPDRPGYVQRIDVDALLEGFADRERLLVRCRPGDFVTEAHPLIEVWPPLDDRRARDIVHGAVNVASARDLSQDSAYGFQQLADIALRALSPSMNDPTTALNCISYLGACLERLTGRAIPAEIRHDPDRKLDAVVRRVSFDEYLAPFIELGRFAGTNARVVCGLVDALSGPMEIADRIGASERSQALRTAAEAIAERGILDAATEPDRDDIRARLARLA